MIFRIFTAATIMYTTRLLKLKINSINQIKILKKATLYLNNKKNNYYDSSMNYLDSVEQNPGYGLIQFWNKGIKKIPSQIKGTIL